MPPEQAGEWPCPHAPDLTAEPHRWARLRDLGGPHRNGVFCLRLEDNCLRSQASHTAPGAISMSANRSRLLSLALAIAAAGLLYGAISGHSRFTNDRGGTDFNVFYSAGRTILDGNASALYSVYTERGPGFTYVYLPMFAVLMAPLSFLPIALGSIIWNLLSLSMVFHSARILYRGCFPAASSDGSLRYPFLIYLIAASVVCLAENLLLGQVHIVLMYLIVLAWKYQRTRMEWAAGCFIGAAAVLKLLPAVFGLYFLLRGQYRALASMCATMLLLVAVVPAIVIGFDTNRSLVNEFYEMQIRPLVSGETTEADIYSRTARQKTLHDQDLGALLMRHFAVDHYLVEEVQAERYQFLNLLSLNTSSVRGLMFPLFATLTIITTIVFFRHRSAIDSEEGAGDLFFSAFVLLSLLLSPRIRLSYLTVLMIPYALMIRNLLAGSDTHTTSSSKRILAVSIGSIALFSLPLFRALTVLYYGLAFLFFGLLRLLVSQDARSLQPDGSTER